MKRIRIEAMSLQNFKGVRSLEIEFSPSETTISGANGTGKSTIFDAFTWCLFGKDSHDSQKFNVKTLDTNGNAIPQILHEVSLTLEIDEERHIYTRQLEEQWVKGHGKTDVELKGNTTHFFIDGIELKKSEYEDAISRIIGEAMYKNLTNPAYFLNQDKDTQRAQLLQMAGTLTDDEIGQQHPELTPIIQAAQQAGNDEMLRRTLKTRRDKIRAELDSCPTQIAAIDSVTPDAPDMPALQAELDQITKRIEDNERSMADYNEAMKIQNSEKEEQMKQLQELKSKQLKRENQLQGEAMEEYLRATESINTITSEIAVANNNLTRFEREAAAELEAIQAGIPTQGQIDSLKAQKEDLLRQWDAVADRQYTASDSGFICPLLKRVCTDPEVLQKINEDGQKARAEFYKHRDTELDAIEQKGALIRDTLNELEEKQKVGEQHLSAAKVAQIRKRNELEQALKEKQKTLAALGPRPERRQVDVTKDEEWQNLKWQIDMMQSATEDKAAGSNDTMLAQARELRQKRDSIQALMATQETIDKNEAAKDRIREREKDLAQQLAEVERDMDSLDAFCKIQMTALEDRVNAMFKLVRFRMFEQQLNGGETPACIAMVDGVPYKSDLNTAARTNAGLDVIRTMQEFYQVTAPIFIDNAEGVNSLLETNAQTILLKVSKDRKLKVTPAE